MDLGKGVAAGVFAAELRGKRSPDDVGEDEMTSRFLGTMSHLTMATQMDILHRLGLVSNKEAPEFIDIVLWPRFENAQNSCEFDAMVGYGGRRLGFEFKWNSEGYADQLATEWRMLEPTTDSLVYVTRGSIRPPEVTAAEREVGIRQGTIIWVSWSRVLRAAREAVTGQRDGRDRRLLEDVLGFLEAVGVTDWDEYLAEYWRVVGNDKAVKAYTGLAQYFKNLRSHLVGKYGATHRIGDPITSFADKSYIEFTPPEVAEFDQTLGIWIVFEHRKQEWYVSLEGKVTYDPAIRAWKVLERAALDGVETGDPKKYGYAAGWRTFQPSAGFGEPEKLRDEVEQELVSFSSRIAKALSGHSRK